MIISDSDELWRDTFDDSFEGISEAYPKSSGLHLPIRAYHQMRYELSEDITEWISRKARESGKTDSRYLSDLITELMRKEAQEEKTKAHTSNKAHTKDGKKILLNDTRDYLQQKKAAKIHNDNLRGVKKKSDNAGLW